MKNKIKIALFVLLIISILGISFIYKEKDNKPKRKKHNSLAIMIKEDENGEYIKSNSKDIPKGNYILNYEKSYCKNNGKIGNYDSTLGKVSFSFIGTDSCYLYFDYKDNSIVRSGYEAILLDNVKDAKTIEQAKNEILQKTKPNFSNASSINEGLFATEDDLGTSFYFRGAVDNNWVVFGKDKSAKDMYWRIIRINGDNSIRMIYTGTTPPTENTKVVLTGVETQINNSKFNSNIDNYTFVGYMFSNNLQQGNDYSSTIKNNIEDWFLQTSLNENTNLEYNQIYCNDRSVIDTTTSSSSNMDYASYTRISTKKNPILTCSNDNDKFTYEKSTIGNKKLKFPVGLITADEVAMAGNILFTVNKKSYLYTNQDYWVGSPLSFRDSNAYSFAFLSDGYLNSRIVNTSIGVRPVISLSSNVKLHGNGTWQNPYKVVENENPVISHLNLNENTISATFTDNKGLSGYAISTSNTVTPTNWEKINGKTYDLNISLTTDGTYYLWVKDTDGNTTVSEPIIIVQKGWQTILANSKINETTPDFNQISTTNEGLFKAQDDLGTSYYFRGAVDNNWVKFGKDSTGTDMYWRIIRINGDGSIRIIYSGTTAPTESTKVVMTGESTSIGKSKFSDGKNSSIYVGYQYVDNKQFGYGKCDGSNASCRIDRSTTIYNSSLKQAIDKWYITTTLYTDESTKNIVSDSIFCNDRSVTEGSWTSSGNMSPVYYSPRTRLETNKSPILTCPNIEDMFTINNITLKNNEIGGNGALTYSVSAITADEVAMAGGVMKLNNTSFYLYSGITYWTLSPIAYHTSTSNVFNVESTGKLNANISGQYYGIRQVINLSKDVKLSGNGTWNNVYEVVN